MEKNVRRTRKDMVLLKTRAYDLFMTTSLIQGEIAAMLEITEKTMSDWVCEQDGQWKKDKAARSITKEKLISSYLRQLQELNERIEQRPSGERVANSGEADIQIKLGNLIEKLEKKFAFGTYYTIMDEYLEFVSKRDQKDAAVIAKHSLDFVKSKIAKLNG